MKGKTLKELGVSPELIGIEKEIRLKLDLAKEVSIMGFRFYCGLDSDEWFGMFNPFDESKMTSAINFSLGENRGFLMRLDTLSRKLKAPAISFWELVYTFHPEFYGLNYNKIISFYAKKYKVKIPGLKKKNHFSFFKFLSCFFKK